MAREEQHITRQRIIDAARTMFMRDGYQATSTRRIAQEVGITQPNLYHHFANKEALYVSVLEFVGEETKNNLIQIKERDSSNLKKSLIEMTNYLKDEYPINFYMMMHDFREELSDKSSYRLYEIFRSAYQDPFIDLFEQHDFEIRSDVETRILATYYFLVIAPYINPESLPHQNLSIEIVVDLFLQGILN